MPISPGSMLLNAPSTEDRELALGVEELAEDEAVDMLEL